MFFIKVKDKYYAKGHVRIILTDKNNKQRVWYDDPNVVVDLGREHAAKVLSGERTDLVDGMIIGNGGASPPNNISNTAPSKTDTSLNGRIGASPLQPGQDTTDADATKTPTVTRTLASIRYDATFSSDDIDHTAYPDFSASSGGANLGLDAIFVSELGLIVTNQSDELFARVTFPPISFQDGSSTSMTIQWTISII